MNSHKVILAIIVNLDIIILTLNAKNLFQKNIEKIHPGKPKSHFYVFFTSDSNLLNALCSLILVPFLVLVLLGRMEYIPTFVYALHFIGTCGVLVTFATVMFFLGPIAGYSKMFKGSDLFLHLICPLLSLVSCKLLVPIESPPFYFTFLGLIPTFVYGVIYSIMVLGVGPKNGGWEDFYTFNRGGKWYVSVLLMLVGTYLIALGLYF